MASSVFDSLATNAHKAIEFYVSQDYPESFLRAGIALEQALKARLARENRG